MTDYTSAMAQPRPRNHPPVLASVPAPILAWATTRTAPPQRRPEPEGLSPAELRRIVIDMIG